MKMKSIVGVLSVLAFPVATWAQADGRIVIHTPDQSGYVKKRTEELIRLSKTKDPNAKTDLYLRLAEERAKELEAMQSKGKTTHHDALGKSYSDHVTRGAGGAIESGAARGQDMTGAVGQYASSTSKHLAVLERVLANAPPAARKGLLNAIEASQHGHQQAMLAHQRGKGRSGAGGGHGGAEQPGSGRGGRSGRPGDDDGPGRGGPGQGKGPGGEDGPGKGKGPGGNEGGPGQGKGPGGPAKGPGDDGPGKGKGPVPGQGPGSDDAPGKGNGPGKAPGADERPGKGRDKGPGGPPPGKGNQNDQGNDNGPGKDKGGGSPPPGKGKGKGNN
jgi:hypothetical protein